MLLRRAGLTASAGLSCLSDLQAWLKLSSHTHAAVLVFFISLTGSTAQIQIQNVGLLTAIF